MGSEPRSINDTPLRRILVRASVKLLRRFCPYRGSVLILFDKICIKHGSLKTLGESWTIQFIAECTTIPVPKVLCSFTHHGSTYIVTKKINGNMIGIGWADRTVESKTKLLLQLKEMVAEMRKITPPDSKVSSVTGGRLYDGRIHGPVQFGPFENTQEFHRYLRGGMEAHHENPHDVNELITWQDECFSRPVFTHGDLSSLNILTRGDEIAGIIDWETAGWYPYYWEYSTASQINPQNLFWEAEIDKFLDPMPQELAMEKIRQKYFGDV